MHTARNPFTCNTENNAVRRAYRYIFERASRYVVAQLDRESIVVLGYDEQTLTEKQISDMALNIDLSQALESEVRRLAAEYGLKKTK